jgi:flavin-dependent dehydrogenase
MPESFDIVIVGGGPAGSTVGSMLKKYAPELRVAIFEREKFPREHVGESLLPPISAVLAEIGAWDAIEAAGFPIKIGATYKWGTTDDLWDFNLLDTREVVDDAPRPGPYEGWRMRSTWQVERGTFDKILLDHARSLGCEVFEETGVSKVETDGDAITRLTLGNGEQVTAKYYVDASGNSGFLRRAVGVDISEPAALRNIAIWDYWENAEWAVSIGVGGTRVQVTSLGYGWLWFIPITPTRTSIGLVCPAEYYKRSGKRPEELYAEAVRADPRIAGLLANAKVDGSVRTTKDWSYLSDRIAGGNWFLVGESAGFADPILAAGLTLAMVGARECAYTLLDLLRDRHEASWLKDGYQNQQRRRISQHIRFANYWYSANAHFTDLMEYTAEIAREAGYEMDAKSAWQWLGTGGFISLDSGGPGLAGHSFEQIKNLQKMMFLEESEWVITKYNVFELRLEGAEVDKYPVYDSGGVSVGKVLRRDGKELPNTGAIRSALAILDKETALAGIIRQLRHIGATQNPIAALRTLEAIETMLKDGWVEGRYVKGQPLLRPEDIPRTPAVDWNRDIVDPKARVPERAGA